MILIQFNLHPVVKKNRTHVEMRGLCGPQLQLTVLVEQLFLSVWGPCGPRTTG